MSPTSILNINVSKIVYIQNINSFIILLKIVLLYYYYNFIIVLL